ncbi:MAG: hypothetical protein WBN81_12645 [Gammaproteobacteria bacterium]
MAVIKRPFFWVVMLLVLALAGMALYVYIVGTRTLLAHAEDFSFRRLDVAQIEDREAFRFFYITNRVQDNLDGPVDTRYQAARESALKYGSFDSTIEPSLGLGIIIDPSEWFLNEEINLHNI